MYTDQLDDDIERLEERVRTLEAALRRVKHELLIPAAEYVPAIPAVWDIIDAALVRTAPAETSGLITDWGRGAGLSWGPVLQALKLLENWRVALQNKSTSANAGEK